MTKRKSPWSPYVLFLLPLLSADRKTKYALPQTELRVLLSLLVANDVVVAALWHAASERLPLVIMIAHAVRVRQSS